MAVLNQIVVLLIHGSFPVWAPRNSARYWTGTHTLAGVSLENPLVKHPTSKDHVGYLNHRLLAMVSIGYPLCPIGAVVV